MSRIKRSLVNFTSHSFLSKLPLLAGFVATPLLLEWLGEETFGSYRVLIQWFSYLALFEIALNGSTLGRISHYVGLKDHNQTAGLLKASIQIGFRFLFLPLSLGLLWVYFVPELIKTTSISNYELRWAAGLLLISLIVSPFTGFRALIDSQQKTYLLSIFNTLRGLLIIGGGLLFAYFGTDLIQLAALEVIVQILITLPIIYLGIKSIPQFFEKKVNANHHKSINSLNSPVLISAVTAHIGLVGDNLIVAWMMGAKAATPFLLTQRLGQMAHGQLLSIGNSTWAALVELRAQKKFDVLRERFLEINELIGGLTVICITPLMIYNQDFMTLWLGPGQYAGSWVNTFIFVNLWISSISSFWGWLIGGIGLQKEWVPYTLAGTTLNIIISLVGCYYLGYLGPLLGTFAEYLFVRCPGQLILVRRNYQISVSQTLLINFKSLFIGTLFGLLIFFFHQQEWATVTTWWQLIAHLSISFIFGIGLFWFLIMSARSKTLWKERILRLF